MNRHKSFLELLRAWVDGKIVLIDADHYISTKKKKQKIEWRELFSAQYLKEHRGAYHFLSVAVSVIFISFMLIVVNELPQHGVASNPVNNEVMERYIQQGVAETGATNIVASMILDYRAFDTFAEANVLFLAVMSVVLLLRADKKNYSAKEKQENEEDEMLEAKSSKLIRCYAAMALTPIIMLYGIYVVINGHLSPGGGFSGGTIIGAGLILYANAFGHEKMKTIFTFQTFVRISVGSLLTYFACKSYSFFTGANHVGWAMPKGVAGTIFSGGFILPLNICVGLIVACTMYGFYALYTKGDI